MVKKSARQKSLRAVPRPSPAGTERSIGSLSREAGVSTATINFYVASGILPPPRRLNRTRAAYSEKHLRVLRLIRQLQLAGHSLAIIGRALRSTRFEDEGLGRIESVGSIQPLPPTRPASGEEPLERFEPVKRKAFLRMLPADAEPLVSFLEDEGLLRPSARRYDALDLWFVRAMATICADGVDISQLSALRPFIAALRGIVPLVLRAATRHAADLSARKLRFRDFIAPYENANRYLFERLSHEAYPGWLSQLLEDPERLAARIEPGKKRK